MAQQAIWAHAAAAGSALSAGAAVVATRFVVTETDALSLVFVRYAIAVACFLPVLWMLWPKGGLAIVEASKIAMFGLLFFVLFPWAFNAALEINPAGRGAVGLATVPIQTLLVAAAFGRERMTVAKLAGVLLAFSGIALAFGAAAFAGSGGTPVGDALMLVGVLCAAVYSVFARETLMRHGPLLVTALGMTCAVIVLVPVMVVRHGAAVAPSFSASGWLAVFFLGTVAGALQFSLFMWALSRLPPTTTVLYLTLNPLAAMTLGIMLLGETLTLELVLGMALVLAGIVVGAGAVRRREPNPA